MKRLIVIALLLSASLAGAQNYAIKDTMTTNKIYIGKNRDTTLACVKQDTINPITLYAGARVWKEKTLTFNYAQIAALTKPTLVFRGVFSGFSLPVYAADNEELFTCGSMPADWDSTTDVRVYLAGWISAAQPLPVQTFFLQISAETVNYGAGLPTENYITGDVVPTTTNDYTVASYVEQDHPAYKGFKVYAEISTSAIGLRPGFPLAIRVRRIAATGTEYAGEIIIEGLVVSYISNRLGSP